MHLFEQIWKDVTEIQFPFILCGGVRCVTFLFWWEIRPSYPSSPPPPLFNTTFYGFPHHLRRTWFMDAPLRACMRIISVHLRVAVAIKRSKQTAAAVFLVVVKRKYTKTSPAAEFHSYQSHTSVHTVAVTFCCSPGVNQIIQMSCWLFESNWTAPQSSGWAAGMNGHCCFFNVALR